MNGNAMNVSGQMLRVNRLSNSNSKRFRTHLTPMQVHIMKYVFEVGAFIYGFFFQIIKTGLQNPVNG
jgi:hypothetical protein